MLGSLLGVSGAGIASRGPVFLSHQIQFSVLLLAASHTVRDEARYGWGTKASLLSIAWIGILIDPTRHIIYDTQFNPAGCDTHDLMTAETFYKLNKLAIFGQWVGYTILFLVLGQDIWKACKKASASHSAGRRAAGS
mmetsp:Transcript_62992/g.150035  ORF Transcript_62992/g.150035 Transcript_62992/m.150035 type:complete len:137 (+) Transcript_62992:301-711(+)